MFILNLVLEILQIEMTSALSSIDTDNCTIYLVDIPPDRNTIPKLNEYFSKFGKVLTVHVGYNGDPGASKVTFASVNEAVAALNCPDAVLNNRFVKMSSKLPTSTSADLDQSDSKNCSHCNRTFASEYHRNWHIKRMHIVCEICHLTFVSTDLYKKHYSAYHPNATRQKKSPKQTLEHERLPKKIDQVAAPEADLLCAKLSEKIKALKGKLKETEKNHAKKMKSLQKEKKHFEAQLKGLLTKKMFAFLWDANILFT